jgi:hypothetical protein
MAKMEIERYFFTACVFCVCSDGSQLKTLMFSSRIPLLDLVLWFDLQPRQAPHLHLQLGTLTLANVFHCQSIDCYVNLKLHPTVFCPQQHKTNHPLDAQRHHTF